MLQNLGERAGVDDVHPHRFRHTFAIEYLRNAGDPWTLQRLLGHSTMAMVSRYLNLAQQDLKDAHARSSAVANWRLYIPK
jgi:site-specific recombinase XerD